MRGGVKLNCSSSITCYSLFFWKGLVGIKCLTFYWKKREKKCFSAFKKMWKWIYV